MHYWAMNGEWNWINFTSEDKPLLEGDTLKQVDYTYLSVTFWDSFDPKKEGQKHAYAACTDPIVW